MILEKNDELTWEWKLYLGWKSQQLIYWTWINLKFWPCFLSVLDSLPKLLTQVTYLERWLLILTYKQMNLSEFWTRNLTTQNAIPSFVFSFGIPTITNNTNNAYKKRRLCVQQKRWKPKKRIFLLIQWGQLPTWGFLFLVGKTCLSGDSKYFKPWLFYPHSGGHSLKHFWRVTFFRHTKKYPPQEKKPFHPVLQNPPKPSTKAQKPQIFPFFFRTLTEGERLPKYPNVQPFDIIQVM